MAEQRRKDWESPRIAEVTCRRILESRVRSIERHYEWIRRLENVRRPPIIDQIARVRAEG